MATCGSHIAESTASRPSTWACSACFTTPTTPEIGDLLLAANQVDFSVAPVAAVLAGQYIGVYRLMGAVKRAKTQMDDTGDQRVAIVAGQDGVSG